MGRDVRCVFQASYECLGEAAWYELVPQQIRFGGRAQGMQGRDHGDVAVDHADLYNDLWGLFKAELDHGEVA